MEKLTGRLLELWDYALLIYRTMVIKAESKRRQGISRIQKRNNNGRKGHLLCDKNRSEIGNYDQSELKQVFDLFDENKDGLISAEELQQYMRRLGIELSDQKVRDLVGAVDTNRDDYVDFEEFVSLYSPLCREGDEGITHDDEEEALLKAFFVFDENKDGLISVPELQQVLLKLGLPEGRSLMCCQKMIARVDADGNGKVDFFEFKEMMSSNAFSLYREQ